MKTIIASESKTVTIDTDGTFTIIGEKINPTGRKKLAAQLKERNFDYVRGLVLKQVEAGADILDVNVGVPGSMSTSAYLVRMRSYCCPRCAKS